MSAVAATPVRVLAVEDERLVARELKVRLNQLGYEVPALASSAGEAIELSGKLRPNVVLMDIRLQGDTDGIEAAKVVRERYGVPVIFVTAHADSETLARASVTEPFGYILKPFDDRELKAAIEMALFKHSAERQLLQTHQRLKQAHRISQLGDWELDFATGKFRVSAEACRILGIACDEGDHVGADQYFAAVHPDEQAMVREAFERARNSGGELRVEHRLATRDADRHVRQYGEFSPADEEHRAHLTGAVQDISEYKRLEERYRRAQRLEAIGRLAGGVAHDFNNLLVVIKGYSDLILSELTARDPLYEPLEQILKAGERAAALTRQLLAFSGSRVMRPEVVDLNSLIRDLQKMLRRILVEDIGIAEEPAPDLWPVRVDANQIEQVIMNLVVNARDAMPKGGKVTITTSNVHVTEEQSKELPGLQTGRFVSLSVSDTGTGMTPEVQKRIFEPFYTTKAAGEGTGLGLSTVYGIVKQHEGAISVYSEVGRGSTFRVYIPADAGGVATTPVEQPRPAAMHGSGTVLLVEDDPTVRKLTSQMLRRLGYQVVAAINGEDALKLADTHKDRIDVLLTDVIMPHINGKELADRISARHPHIKTVFMSGYPGTITAERGLSEVSSPFLQKPFSKDDLGRRIKEALDTKGESAK